MSKYTTTIYEIIQSELILNGFNEFLNDGKLTWNDPDTAFMQKVLFFDEDVKEIVDEKIFKGCRLSEKAIDTNFKSSFINRFMDREIGRQTLEAFASQVVYVFLTHQEYIEYVFSKLEQYMDGVKTSESHEDENNTNIYEHREAEAELPQTEVNLSVDDDDLTFADNNRIVKEKTTNDSEKNSDSEDKDFNPENLNAIYHMKSRILDEFDEKCFLQIW